MSAFTLAHLSDPHLAPLPAPSSRELIGKRAIGYLNWRRKRGRIHQRAVLDMLVEDLRQQAYDHLAVTGDLVNIALAGEFPPARAWLETLGDPHHVSVIPGNHDTYTRDTQSMFDVMSAPFRMGDDAVDPLTPYPYIRRRGAMTLIGLSSAIPTAPFMATGTLGEQQLSRLHRILAQERTRGTYRVILVHHPLRSSAGDWYKRLTDSPQLQDIIRQNGADLILHGHDHRHSIMWFDSVDGPVPAIGVPSASGAADGRHEGAAYHLFHVVKNGTISSTELVMRGIHADHPGEIRKLKRFMLKPETAEARAV